MLNRSSFEKGLKVEMEHKATYEWLKHYIARNKKMPNEQEFFLHIVSDHLTETPDYYEKLLKAGL